MSAETRSAKMTSRLVVSDTRGILRIAKEVVRQPTQVPPPGGVGRSDCGRCNGLGTATLVLRLSVGTSSEQGSLKGQSLTPIMTRNILCADRAHWWMILNVIFQWSANLTGSKRNVKRCRCRLISWKWRQVRGGACREETVTRRHRTGRHAAGSAEQAIPVDPLRRRPLVLLDGTSTMGWSTS